MRHLPALAAPLLLIGASWAAEAGSFRIADQSNCPKPAKTPDKAEFKRLADLPPANAYQAVLRSDQRGCIHTIPIRQDIGRPR
jgi:hypothetical protein